MTAGLRILMTNSALDVRAGSEVYVQEVATALLRRGHLPVAYSTALGPMAEALRAATIPVVDDLDALGAPPDLIHGQHHLETMTALLRFPGVPALYVCHGWRPWQEAPPRFPRIRHYVAVDEPCRDRLVSEHGIPPGQVSVVPNFVDLERFRRRAPLPQRPARALVFGNAVRDADVELVRQVCAPLGIPVDAAGIGVGNPCAAPERLLGRYDLVFAKARCALEALAVGTAVVLHDPPRMGPMVGPAEVERLRALNFGVRALTTTVEPEALAREVARYDANDAAVVCSYVRGEADREAAVEQLLAIYDRVLAAHRAAPPADPLAETRAAAAYLEWVGPFFKRVYDEKLRRSEQLAAEAGGVRAERDALSIRCTALAAERDRIRTERDRHLSERNRLVRELGAATGSATFRLRERVLETPLLGSSVRLLARAAKGRLYR